MSINDIIQSNAGKARVNPMAPKPKEEDKGSPFGRGLGFLINNPVTQAVLKPLEVLDYGRRAVTLGAEELAEGLGSAIGSLGAEDSGWRDFWDQELGNPDDTRSNWDKLKDPTYGVGQLLGDVTWDDSLGNFFDKGLGFVGDVALDPTTYIAGLGVVGRGGTTLSKANRASLAAEMLEKGIDPADVSRFVRRGANAVDQPVLDAIGASRPGIHVGLTPKNSVRLPGTERVGRAVGNTLGTTNDLLRRTRVGEKVAGLRTPDTMEDAYQRLFHNRGPLSFDAAAERVTMENAKRAIGQTFRRTQDLASKDLRKRLSRLDTDTGIEMIDSIESGIPMRDANLQPLRDEYAQVYREIMNAAGEAGLETRFRRRYTPHILTRDASKWLRDGGADTGTVRESAGIAARSDDVFTQNLYDPSGVTMARQFQPGQTIELNGQAITFDPTRPVTIKDVNTKFRDAGLDFDFFESKPEVVLDKYLDMIAEDVGRAGSIKSRVGAGGGVHQLTEEEQRLLGMGGETKPNAIIRGQGEAVQEGDIGVLRSQNAAELAPNEPEVLTAGRATERVLDAKKDGSPKLTPSGKAKAADGIAVKDMDPETDWKWKKKPLDKTVEYNRSIREGLKTKIENARESRLKAQTRLDEALQNATLGAQGVIDSRYRVALDAASNARQRLAEAERLMDSIFTQADEFYDMARAPQQALDQLDQVIATFQRDIEVMDSFLAKARARNYTPALKQVREELVQRRDELAEIITEAKKQLPDMTPSGPMVQAQLLESAAATPVIAARREYENVLREVEDAAGLAAKETEIRQLADELGFERADINEIRAANETLSGSLKSKGQTLEKRARDARDAQVARMRKLLREHADIKARVAKDSRVTAAKRKLDIAGQRAESMPASEARALIETGGEATMTTKTPNVPGGRSRGAAPIEFEGRAAGRRGTSAAPVSGEELKRLQAEELELNNALREAKQELDEVQDAMRQTPELLGDVSNEGGKISKQLNNVRREMKKEGIPNASQSSRYKPTSARATRLRAEESRLLSELRQAKVAPLERKVENIYQKINQNQARQAARAGGDVVPTAAESAASLRRVQGDIGARETARQMRQSAAEKARPAMAQLSEAIPEYNEINQLLTDIIKNPEVRDQVRTERVEELVKSIVERQAPTRELSQDVINAAQVASRKYADELASIDEGLSSLMREFEDALTDRGAATRAAEEARQNVQAAQATLRQYNVKAFANELDPDTGRPLARPAAEARKTGLPADELDAYEQSLSWYIDDLKATLDAADLPPDVRTATEVYLNDAVKELNNVRKADLTEAKYTAMKQDKNFGRVVEARLDEAWTQAYRHLIGDDIVVSQELVQSFNRIKTAAYDKNFWPFIDTMTNLFKTYATLTPGFHTRNFMSAAFMNSVEGVPMRTQYEGARLMSKYLRAANPDEWLAKQSADIQEAFKAAFGSGIGGRYSERGIGRRGTARARASEKAFDNWLTRNLGQKAGGWVEGAVRLPVALDSIRRGGNVSDALNRVTRTHFDYSQVSRFDERMKRLIPFWTFMSRNLPLQLTSMYTKPRTYAKYKSFIRNFSGTPEENEPDYFGEVGAFRFGDTNLGGLPMYLQPDLAHTRLEEDIDKLLNVTEDPGRLFTDFTPLLTVPAEYMFGKDLYTGRTYNEDDVRTTGLLEKPIEMLARIMPGQSVQTEGGNTAVSERFINAFRSMIPVYDRAVRLAPGAVTGQSSSDANNRQIESYLRFLGVPVRQLSPEQQNAQRRSEYFDKRDDLNMRRALARIDQGG